MAQLFQASVLVSNMQSLQIAAVVTQPGRPRGRGSKAPQPSIVAEKATALGYAAEQILSPVKASEVHPPPSEVVIDLCSCSSHARAASAWTSHPVIYIMA